MNTTRYFTSLKDVVGYADDILRRLRFDYPSTMTIRPVKSGGYYVETVIVSSSDDTAQEWEARFFSETQVNT